MQLHIDEQPISENICVSESLIAGHDRYARALRFRLSLGPTPQNLCASRFAQIRRKMQVSFPFSLNKNTQGSRTVPTTPQLLHRPSNTAVPPSSSPPNCPTHENTASKKDGVANLANTLWVRTECNLDVRWVPIFL